MAQSNLVSNHINMLEEEQRPYICDMDFCDWYKDVIGYLQKMTLPPKIDENKSTIKFHVVRYAIIGGELWWRSNEGVLLKYVDRDRSRALLEEIHNGVCGGHYMAKTKAHKILRSRFRWPTIFKDAH